MFNNNLINDSIDAIVNDASSYTSIDDIDCNSKKQKKKNSNSTKFKYVQGCI